MRDFLLGWARELKLSTKLIELQVHSMTAWLLMQSIWHNLAKTFSNPYHQLTQLYNLQSSVLCSSIVYPMGRRSSSILSDWLVVKLEISRCQVWLLKVWVMVVQSSKRFTFASIHLCFWPDFSFERLNLEYLILEEHLVLLHSLSDAKVILFRSYEFDWDWFSFWLLAKDFLVLWVITTISITSILSMIVPSNFHRITTTMKGQDFVCGHWMDCAAA